MAHPGKTRKDHLIPDLIAAGLPAIEVYHPDHDEADTARYRQMADRSTSWSTGGSDYHGPGSGREVGVRARSSARRRLRATRRTAGWRPTRVMSAAARLQSFRSPASGNYLAACGRSASMRCRCRREIASRCRASTPRRRGDARAADTGASLPDEGTVPSPVVTRRDIQTDTEWLTSLDCSGWSPQRAVLMDSVSLDANMALPFTLSIDPLPPRPAQQVACRWPPKWDCP